MSFGGAQDEVAHLLHMPSMLTKSLQQCVTAPLHGTLHTLRSPAHTAFSPGAKPSKSVGKEVGDRVGAFVGAVVVGAGVGVREGLAVGAEVAAHDVRLPGIGKKPSKHLHS